LKPSQSEGNSQSSYSWLPAWGGATGNAFYSTLC